MAFIVSINNGIHFFLNSHVVERRMDKRRKKQEQKNKTLSTQKNKKLAPNKATSHF
jgi:hypothetical protein